MAVLVRRSRLQQPEAFSLLGQPRHAAFNQWIQLVADTPCQDKRSFPARRKFECQFVLSGVGKDGVRLEVRLMFQSLKLPDELCALGAAEIRQIQHSNMLPLLEVHQPHYLVLRRVGFGRDQRDWQLVDRSRMNSVADLHQRPRRTGVHHNEHGIWPKG